MKSTQKSLSSTEAWLTALASLENRVEIDFHGVPAFYTARPGWINQPPPFRQHLIYYAVNGSFRVRKDGKEYTVEAGTLLWIPPRTEFSCWLPGNKPASFYRFRLRVENRQGEILYCRNAPLLIRGIEPVQRWFEEIVRSTHQSGKSLRLWRLRGALISLFAEAQASKAASEEGGRLHSLQRQTLEEMVHRDSKIQITPAGMATHLGLSSDYFTRLFRKTYGVSPRVWIVRERIKMAAVRLLESHLNVGEVAEEFGYRDIFFFSHQFKQIMGQSPKHYRHTMNI